MSVTGITYFIATHTNPAQALRLVATLDRQAGEEDRILIHHDPRGEPLDGLEAFPRVRRLPPRPVDWGGMSQVELSLAAIDWALRENDPAWLVFLSGQDYPLKPLRHIADELEGSGLDGYIEADPVDAIRWQLGRARYLYRYPRWAQMPFPAAAGRALSARTALLNLGHRAPRMNVWVQDGVARFGIRRSPFDRRFRCWKGSSWWTLSNRALRYVISFVNRSPAYLDHFANVAFAADEAFFNSILANATALRMEVANNLRYVRMRDSAADSRHPDVLRSEDLERMLMSGRHFARKFDPAVDSEVLDRLDARITTA